MFFFVPYQVISDAWKNASNDGVIGGKRNNFWLAGFILFWVSGLIGGVGNLAWGSAETFSSIDDAITGDTVLAVSGFFQMVTWILIAIAFNQMSKRHAQ